MRPCPTCLLVPAFIHPLHSFSKCLAFHSSLSCTSKQTVSSSPGQASPGSRLFRFPVLVGIGSRSYTKAHMDPHGPGRLPELTSPHSASHLLPVASASSFPRVCHMSRGLDLMSLLPWTLFLPSNPGHLPRPLLAHRLSATSGLLVPRSRALHLCCPSLLQSVSPRATVCPWLCHQPLTPWWSCDAGMSGLSICSEPRTHTQSRGERGFCVLGAWSGWRRGT